MKNKLMILLVVLVALVFTLVACGETTDTTADTTTVPAVTTTTTSTTATVVTTTPLEGEDAMAAYKFFSQKMNTLKGCEIEMVNESSYAGETSLMEATVKINLVDGKKGFMSMTDDSVDYVVDSTYIDGVVYMLVKMPGVEMKYKTEDESMTSTFEGIFAAFETKKDGENKIESVVFGKRENGVYTLVATQTKEAALESIMEDYEGLDIDASAFSNVSKTMTFECTADGYVTKSVERLTYTFDGEVCSEITTLTFKNAGTLPEISTPADADSYMNMDEME